MRWMDNRGVRYLQFPSLVSVPGVWHGIFTRWAYNDDGSRAALNIGLNNGDPQGQVQASRHRMLDVAGGQTAIFARQVHGADVAIWDRAPEVQSLRPTPSAALSGDALVTAVADSALVIQTADCQSVLMVDPQQRVVANVHAGWRGSIQNVVGRTVQTMVERYHCNPDGLICGVGPSLGPCCAEFVHYRQEIPEIYWSYRLPGDYFDFWRITQDQLVAAGVPRKQVAVSGMCTRCNPGLFFSHRGEGPGTGRFAAVIRLTA
ncbi:MAG: laccase domain-containing protein [Desulfatitalea sp.]|nr:laccase domain-containing protein [Desulfatitalea sp.]